MVIGLNAGWKQAMNIGRVNNQKFCSIPHRRLLDMIQYKAERHGIEVVIREESYTSKASCLDMDAIPDYQAVKERKDRKSTRLNSSHVATSYAVFCLKKKINLYDS